MDFGFIGQTGCPTLGVWLLMKWDSLNYLKWDNAFLISENFKYCSGYYCFIYNILELTKIDLEGKRFYFDKN